MAINTTKISVAARQFLRASMRPEMRFVNAGSSIARNIEVELVRRIEHDPKRVTLLTSAAGDGKTTLIYRLAQTFFQKGWRVLISEEWQSFPRFEGDFTRDVRRATVLMIDRADEISNLGPLYVWIARNPSLRIVLTSREIDWQNRGHTLSDARFHHIRLPRLEIDGEITSLADLFIKYKDPDIGRHILGKLFGFDESGLILNTFELERKLEQILRAAIRLTRESGQLWHKSVSTNYLDEMLQFWWRSPHVPDTSVGRSLFQAVLRAYGNFDNDMQRGSVLLTQWAILEDEAGNNGDFTKEFSARWLFKKAYELNSNNRHALNAWGILEGKSGNAGDFAKEFSACWLFKKAFDIVWHRSEPNHTMLFIRGRYLASIGAFNDFDGKRGARSYFEESLKNGGSKRNIYNKWTELELNNASREAASEEKSTIRKILADAIEQLGNGKVSLGLRLRLAELEAKLGNVGTENQAQSARSLLRRCTLDFPDARNVLTKWIEIERVYGDADAIGKLEAEAQRLFERVPRRPGGRGLRAVALSRRTARQPAPGVDDLRAVRVRLSVRLRRAAARGAARRRLSRAAALRARSILRKPALFRGSGAGRKSASREEGGLSSHFAGAASFVVYHHSGAPIPTTTVMTSAISSADCCSQAIAGTPSARMMPTRQTRHAAM